MTWYLSTNPGLFKDIYNIQQNISNIKQYIRDFGIAQNGGSKNKYTKR